MALFLPNLFTNFVMFNHAWKHEGARWNIIFSVTQNRTCELPQFLRDFDYAIM